MELADAVDAVEIVAASGGSMCSRGGAASRILTW
jgi:hypothetical protein